MGFLNIIIEKISFENKSYIYFLFLFNLGIQILLGTTLPLSLSADSYHYLQIANAFDITNFISKDSLGNRSIGYPFFLYILGSKTIIGTTIIIFVQSLMAILTPVLIFIFLSNNPWKNQLNIAKIVAFFLSIFPKLFKAWGYSGCISIAFFSSIVGGLVLYFSLKNFSKTSQ